MRHPVRAFLDTNVLFGNPSTDMLLSVAERPYRMFTPLWNRHVLDELREHLPGRLLRIKNDADTVSAETRMKAEHRIREMEHAFPDAEVLMPEGILDRL